MVVETAVDTDAVETNDCDETDPVFDCTTVVSVEVPVALLEMVAEALLLWMVVDRVPEMLLELETEALLLWAVVDVVVGMLLESAVELLVV